MGARTQPIRALIVDDEPLARAGLRALLAQEPEVEVVGEAGNGRVAAEAIRRLRPDLLFLDISMPQMDGFALLDEIGSDAPPDTIFVTAYSHHAVRAFDVHAVDYLLKPVNRERFHLALDRAKERLRTGQGTTAHLQALTRKEALMPRAPVEQKAEAAHRIAVRSTGRVRFVRIDRIDWIEAADYYSKLHLGERSHLIRRSMKSLEESLDPERFVRIHRSAIVNVERVQEIQTRPHGGHSVILRDGTQLQLSRSRRRALQALLP